MIRKIKQSVFCLLLAQASNIYYCSSSLDDNKYYCSSTLNQLLLFSPRWKFARWFSRWETKISALGLVSTAELLIWEIFLWRMVCEYMRPFRPLQKVFLDLWSGYGCGHGYELWFNLERHIVGVNVNTKSILLFFINFLSVGHLKK